MFPRLETKRLIMREWRERDLDVFAKIFADAEVMRFLTGMPMSRIDAWRFMANSMGHWELRGYGTWVVERKSDHATLGRVGLINPEGWPGLEVGWTLDRHYWRQGYATEAAEATLNYGFLTQGVSKLISLIDPNNKASQAVARRIGQTQGPEHTLDFMGHTHHCHIWGITREDWRKRAVLP